VTDGEERSARHAYIEKSADLARPILTHLRAVVHEACPDCEETLKWRIPALMYKGLLAGMVAFKEWGRGLTGGGLSVRFAPASAHPQLFRH
jgi:hypothetical protein